LHVGLTWRRVSAPEVRGLHVGLHAVTGKPHISAGLPGTGLSIREYGRPVKTGAHPTARWASPLARYLRWLSCS
jgi:hypothetical protein